MFSKILQFSFVLLAALPAHLNAKDFGVRGHVFEIAEEDISKVIERRFKKIDMDKLNQEFAERTEKYVKRPTPVVGIKHTAKEKTFYYDPTYVVKADIKDHRGKILYKKGHKVNPFDHISLEENLIFIDGDDSNQVDFAVDYLKRNKAKIVLVNGSPIELQRKYKIWIYFDQKGVLTTKLGIKQVPAIVSQKSKKLKIAEIKLSSSKNESANKISVFSRKTPRMGELKPTNNEAKKWH